MSNFEAPTAAETFAEWALALQLEDIPISTRSSACRHLLDGVGNAMAAARLQAAPFVLPVSRESDSPSEATVLGYGDRLPTAMAAFANGCLVHALDYDDTHSKALIHPTSVVLPAAFAVGEESGVSGDEVLVACIAAYEMVIRLGAAVPHGFHRRGFHPTSVCGVFAATLVASRLQGMSPEKTVSALGIAGSMASGSLEFLNTGSSTKQIHPGLASSSGILAARLAASGADGPRTIFEGEHGLFRAFADAEVPTALLTADLGERWETERITIKPYPACQLSHASLDAVQEMLPMIDTTKAIDEITTWVPAESVSIICEPLDSKRRPRTTYEAKFSLPWCIAALLHDRKLEVSTFEPGQIGRKSVSSLAGRVHYRVAEFEGPPADAPGVVEVVVDGHRLRSEVSRSRGGPTTPLSDEGLLDKFIANCGPEYREGDRLSEMIMELAGAASLSEIMKLTVLANG